MILTTACRKASFITAEGMLDDVRMIKEQDEIKKLLKSANLTERVMSTILDQVKSGETMRRLALKIESMGRMLGASDVSFPIKAGFCKTGSNQTEEMFNYSEEQGLEEGSSIAFDVGFVVDGYCSDWGRSFYFGKPDEYDSIDKAWAVSFLLQKLSFLPQFSSLKNPGIVFKQLYYYSFLFFILDLGQSLGCFLFGLKIAFSKDCESMGGR